MDPRFLRRQPDHSRDIARCDVLLLGHSHIDTRPISDSMQAAVSAGFTDFCVELPEDFTPIIHDAGTGKAGAVRQLEVALARESGHPDPESVVSNPITATACRGIVSMVSAAHQAGLRLHCVDLPSDQRGDLIRLGWEGDPLGMTRRNEHMALRLAEISKNGRAIAAVGSHHTGENTPFGTTLDEALAERGVDCTSLDHSKTLLPYLNDLGDALLSTSRSDGTYRNARDLSDQLNDTTEVTQADRFLPRPSGAPSLIRGGKWR